MAKAAAARARRSKADVQQEFLKIREEVAATREGRNAKVEEAATLREAEVRRAVDDLSVEGVAQTISTLSVQISKSLADLSDNLIAEVQRLMTIREAVALESEGCSACTRSTSQRRHSISSCRNMTPRSRRWQWRRRPRVRHGTLKNKRVDVPRRSTTRI